MLVEIQSTDNGSGCNTLLKVYKAYNEKMKLFEQRPFCSIEQDDFFEIFDNPEKQFDLATLGKIHFRVPISKVIEKSKNIYSAI